MKAKIKEEVEQMIVFMRILFMLLMFPGFVRGDAMGQQPISIVDGIEVQTFTAPAESVEPLLEHVDEDVRKALKQGDVCAFELGLCWEDGYHRFRTEDPELVEAIRKKVCDIMVRTDEVTHKYACDCDYELIFVTADGKMHLINLNDWRFEEPTESGATFYELRNDEGLWELCNEVYENGEAVENPWN